MRTLLNSVAFAPEDGTGSEVVIDKVDDGVKKDAPETILAKVGDDTPDPAKVAEQDAAAKVEARKAELAAMSPEDRAKAEAADKEAADALAADAKLAEIPEDGVYEFTLPDGIQIDEKLAAAASPILKDAKVSRGAANKLAEFLTNQKKAEVERWAETQENWVKDAKSDKEYGGDKFGASVETAKKSLEKFGTPALREALVFSGMGNHPEMIRFMARVGNAFSDDRPVGSETPAAKGKSAEEELYGATTPLKRGK